MKHPLPKTILHSIREDALAIVLLLAICCIAYWPLTFNVLSLKNDALNYFLPVRFQVSEAIYNHRYPFWSPYFNLGYPLHGDMQSGVWNPVVQFLSLFGPYTLYKLQLETIFYIFLSGSGMYFLLKRAGIGLYANIFASSAYMLCGFNSDCCQFLNWISSTAFLPFVILFYCRMLQDKKISTSLLAGFFLYLMFVCAYPAHFIVTLYLLFAIFIYNLIIQTRKKKAPFPKILLSNLPTHISAVACFSLLSMPAILSYMEFLPMSQRGTGASFADAMSNPLHPLLLFSYFTPLPVYSAPFAGITDGLERNSYFGIITFIFCLSSFFVKTTDPRVKFCRIAAIIFLVLSLGEFGGLRQLVYYLLPLMNTFRHPASIKLFTIFLSCILAAWRLHLYTHNEQPGNKIKKATIFSCAVLLLLFIYSLPALSGIFQKTGSLFAGLYARKTSAVGPSIKIFLSGLTFKETLLLDDSLQILFISIFLVYLLIKKNYKAFVVLNIVNCIIHVFLFTPYTVVKKDSTAGIQNLLRQNIVPGYPTPSLTASLEDNSAEGMSRFDEIGCLNMYNKKIGRVDYRISPCNLLSQNDFWFDTTVRNTVMKYPLLYKVDSAISVKDTSTMHYTGDDRKLAVIEDPAVLNSINRHRSDSHNNLSVASFAPDHFAFTSNSPDSGFYVLLQNDYPLWKLKIDGAEKTIIRSNLSFMGFAIPAGSHKIEFFYSARHLVFAWCLSILLTIVLLILLLQQYLHSTSRHFMRYIFP